MSVCPAFDVAHLGITPGIAFFGLIPSLDRPFSGVLHSALNTPRFDRLGRRLLHQLSNQT